MLPVAAGLGLAAGGALLGGLSSAFGTSDKNARLRHAGKEIDQLRQEQDAGYRGIQQGLEQAYSPYTANASEDLNAYRTAARNLGSNLQQYGDAGSFEFDLNAAIDKLMDPYLGARTEAATRAMEGSAANAGKLNSSATLQGIAKRSGEIYSDAWKDALNAAQRQQSQEYGQWSDQIARERAAIDQANSNLTAQLSALSGLSNMGQNAVMGLANTSAGLQGENLTNQGNLQLQKIAMRTQQASPLASGLSGAMTGATGVINGLYGH